MNDYFSRIILSELTDYCHSKMKICPFQVQINLQVILPRPAYSVTQEVNNNNVFIGIRLNFNQLNNNS